MTTVDVNFVSVEIIGSKSVATLLLLLAEPLLLSSAFLFLSDSTSHSSLLVCNSFSLTTVTPSPPLILFQHPTSIRLLHLLLSTEGTVGRHGHHQGCGLEEDFDQCTDTRCTAAPTPGATHPA
jgi:hypothetical protein